MITTITLELVRHGSLHNQLVSPLTPYIALAGNRSAETVHVPVEHAQMLAKLRRLRYASDSEGDDISADARAFRSTADLREASQIVTRFLEQIRGLSDAISDAMAVRLATPDGEGEGPEDLEDASFPTGIIRLKLIVSANELAMLPFELAQGPLALGGSDMLSALRPPPVVITRESRRSAYCEFQFKPVEKYRVLVIAADPERRGLPLRGALLALRRAYPTHLTTTGNDPNDHAKAFTERVKVLPTAALEDVRAEMADQSYSHVLVLAHGRMPEALDGQPTILLHSARDNRKADEVSGERLAAALCAPRSADGTKHRKPLFVSLMVCDSGGQAQAPLFAGGSIAHTVHESGVPFVVASQFPLTFGGAVLLTEVLFGRLLKNHHPTAAIAEARQRLFVELGATHDWASLVAYVTLPDDTKLDDDVRDRRFEYLHNALYQAMLAVDPLEHFDRPEHTDLLDRFRAALSGARAAFDTVYDGLRNGCTRDRFEHEDESKEKWPDYALYATILANACLRNARAEAGGTPIWKLLTPTPQADSPKAEIITKVRASLLDVLHYCRAHLFFGGKNVETDLHMTLVMEILSTGTGRDAVRKWWWAADWRMVDEAVENAGSADIFFLGTRIIHLLLALQIGEVGGLDVEKSIDDAATRVVLHHERGSREERTNMERLRRRLHRCRTTWWPPETPAIRKLDKIEARWEAAGIPKSSSAT